MAPAAAALADEAYAALLAVLHEVDDDASWLPTGCRGWAVRDLTYHLLGDAQRALVALHTPADGAADRDAVTYWSDWAPDPDGAARGRRHTRVVASLFLVWDQLRSQYVETVAAVRHAAAAADPTVRVRTQGHALTVADLLSTLCVEATLHHLDLLVALPGLPGPTAAGLAEVRRVVDGLLGEPAGESLSDERYARLATGRAMADVAERALLRDVLGQLPVFS
jgi:hypothetical protein